MYRAMGELQDGLGAVGTQGSMSFTWRQADLRWRLPEFMADQPRADFFYIAFVGLLKEPTCRARTFSVKSLCQQAVLRLLRQLTRQSKLKCGGGVGRVSWWLSARVAIPLEARRCCSPLLPQIVGACLFSDAAMMLNLMNDGPRRSDDSGA